MRATKRPTPKVTIGETREIRGRHEQERTATFHVG